jgi:hypothetical protein
MVIKSGKNAGKMRTYCAACENAMSRASKAKKGPKKGSRRDPAAAGPSNRAPPGSPGSPESVVIVAHVLGYRPPPGSLRTKPRKQATPKRKGPFV